MLRLLAASLLLQILAFNPFHSAAASHSYEEGLDSLRPETSRSKERRIRLDNNLDVYLISNAERSFASASLNVGVGSLSDPFDARGTAHFLEHLLFLGTKSFPIPDEFMDHCKSLGGYSNAYTAPHNTNYHFKVRNDGLESTLERFAEFFIHPLFVALLDLIKDVGSILAKRYVA